MTIKFKNIKNDNLNATFYVIEYDETYMKKCIYL